MKIFNELLNEGKSYSFFKKLIDYNLPMFTGMDEQELFDYFQDNGFDSSPAYTVDLFQKLLNYIEAQKKKFKL